MSSTFSSRQATYQIIVAENQGSITLDEVDVETYKHESIHSMTMLRSPTNEGLLPYDTRMLHRYFQMNNTVLHPHTREDISYLRPMIEEKYSFLVDFPQLKTCDMTPKFLGEMWLADRKMLMEKKGSDQLNHKIAAYLDLETLEKSGYLFLMSIDEAAKFLQQQRSEFCWLLRKSSKHSSLPNADFVSIATKSDGKINHFRLVYLRGVGWYSVGGDVSSSAEIIKKYSCTATNLFAALDKVRKRQCLDWSDLLLDISHPKN